MIRQVIAFGYGGFSTESYPSVVDTYILEQCHKENPRICFLPTASENETSYALKFYDNLKHYNAQLSWLSLFKPQTNDIGDYLLSSDIIYVGGGNTKSMLAIWRGWGIDTILKRAYENGIILCGISAGATCWFDYCFSEEIPDTFTELKGLGIIEGILNVHQEALGAREKEFERIVYNYSIGYGVQDNYVLHFIDKSLSRAFSIDGVSKGYIYKAGNKVEIIV